MPPKSEINGMKRTGGKKTKRGWRDGGRVPFKTEEEPKKKEKVP